METLTDIFITLLLMVVIGGSFWCLLKLWGKFIKYSTVKGGHTFLTDRESR